MGRLGWITLLVCSLGACGGTATARLADQEGRAERFFRGVYGCDPSVVAELGSPDISISYPIFQELFNAPVIRGRDRVERFAAEFCTRWQDAEFTIHESVAEGDHVVLMWDFAARNVASGERVSWGGISIFQFDDAGRIVAEVGEESAPGPHARLSGPTAAP